MYFMHKIVNTRGPAHSNGIEHPHCTKHVDEVKVADGAAIGRHRRVKANMITVNFIQKPINGKKIEYTRMINGTTKIGRIGSNSTKHPHGPEHDHDERDREDKRMATKAALADARGREQVPILIALIPVEIIAMKCRRAHDDPIKLRRTGQDHSTSSQHTVTHQPCIKINLTHLQGTRRRRSARGG